MSDPITTAEHVGTFAPAIARENAAKLREVAEYYDRLAKESAAHGFVAAPEHKKEIADFLRLLAAHLE